jgi:two-component system, NarL family, response regulator DesR
MAVIRVLLVDEMPLVRGGLIALLDHHPEMEVVGDADWGDAIVPMAVDLYPDVLVISTDLPVSHLLRTLTDLQAHLDHCSILVLIDPRKPVMPGAWGRTRSLSFLTKNAAPHVLADTIVRVAAGERVIDSQIAVAALMGAESVLTSREVEVLQLAAGGASVHEIADKLGLSRGTVRNYLSTVIAKTAARNRIDAIRIAKEAGWLA